MAVRDQTARPPTETLDVGPARPPLLERLPTRRLTLAVCVVVFLLGAAAGAGTVLSSQDRPAEPRSVPADEHAVELVLFSADPPRTHPGDRTSDAGPLLVESAVLLSGVVTSTVLSIDSADPGLGVRAPALPVTVSPTARLRELELRIVVRDCKAAAVWPPVDRPFTSTWRDEHGREHLDRAGDFDRTTARSLASHVDAVCRGDADR